jgi:hypothetical protein
MTVVCVIGLALLVIGLLIGCLGSGRSSDTHVWRGQFSGYEAITENADGNRKPRR